MKKEAKQDNIPLLTTDLERESMELLEAVELSCRQAEGYYPRIIDQEERDSLEEEVLGTVESMKRSMANMRKAYAQTYQAADELEARYNDLERTEKKRKLIQPAPANAMIDFSESRSNHFAQGKNLYKLFWVFFIGCIAGVAVELLWCLFRYGYLESRNGMIWGPFSPIYGMGAAALTVALYRFRNHSGWISFAGGMIVGSVLEYVCSWAQETVFGSRSWDYSAMPFNINGRICLLYSVFWGVLGILWIKDLYPRMAKLILKIPNKCGKVLTWALAAFMVLNAAMSVVTVYRWSQRVQNVEAPNAFWEYIDEHYPDERMEGVFANMEFGY